MEFLYFLLYFFPVFFFCFEEGNDFSVFFLFSFPEIMALAWKYCSTGDKFLFQEMFCDFSCNFDVRVGGVDEDHGFF